ncbi:unnamed protein product [Cercopithifilaria johnstoni]|uniref:Beta-mannosidase Ig-fold domain-containing protein n=1 Tax=Cercopithifilaria johnstoni TaxID=2874296 RepID=A0A8J2M096_9BILA|nr:unnamed protein product [Cercopithifilaria johnstoni]
MTSVMRKYVLLYRLTLHTAKWRGRLTEDGRGNTMCALYWQLNDLWVAPTWSTIDFELSWKPAHYFARRFFAPVILSLVVNDDVHLFIVSDLSKPILNITVVLEIFWIDRFFPVNVFKQQISSVPPLSSIEIPINRTISKVIREKGNDRYVLRGRMLSSNDTQIGYDAVHLHDKLFKIDEVNFGKAWIRKLYRRNDLLYELKLEADKIAPFVYMELAPGLIGWFSDNAFTMTEPRKTVMLSLFKEPEYQLTKNNITICSLHNCGKASI